MKTRTAFFLLGFVLLAIEALIYKATATEIPLPEQLTTIQQPTADELSNAKPIAIFGLYNCRGWAGVIIVLENGTVVGPLSMRPADAQAFAKKAGIPTEHQQHLFPAQGECARVAPYEDQLRNQDTSTI